MTGRRRHPKDEDIYILNNPFVGDEARLGCSKKFRHLDHTTQVVTLPDSLSVRNRMTHTLETASCAVVVANLLGLNTDLARAIAIGHDIGHVPFGHVGEDFMARAMGRKEFCHEIMGVVIAQKIERKGAGLNLTRETLEGMLRHSGNMAIPEMSQEAWVVRWADKLAYLFHDFNDISERLGWPMPPELIALMNKFGANQRERTNMAIAGLIIESAEVGYVSFEHSETAKDFAKLQEFMMVIYKRVIQQNPKNILEPTLEFLQQINPYDPFLLLALMTDRDVVYLASQPSKNFSHLHQTALREVLPYLEEIGKIDLCDPDLDW